MVKKLGSCFRFRKPWSKFSVTSEGLPCAKFLPAGSTEARRGPREKEALGKPEPVHGVLRRSHYLGLRDQRGLQEGGEV